MFVILFPQLVCVVYYKRYCNTYGSLAAYFVGFFLRALGGESILNMPPILKYPGYNEIDGQLFPFRTFAMLSSFATLLSVSALSIWLFESGYMPPNFDIFGCVINIPEDVCVVHEPHEEMTVLSSSQALYYQTSEINGRVNPALETEDDAATNLLGKNGSSGNNSNNSMRTYSEKKSLSSQLSEPTTPKSLAKRTNSMLSKPTEPKKNSNKEISVSKTHPKPMPNIESVSPGQVIITKL